MIVPDRPARALRASDVFGRVACALVATSIGTVVAAALTMGASPSELAADPSAWGAILFYSAFILLGQICLLAAAPHWNRGLQPRSGPMWVSILIGASLAAILCGGLIGAVISVPYALDWSDVRGGEAMMIVTGVFWLWWLAIFAWAGRSPWREKYRKVYVWLVRGTILELAVTVPVDLLVRRRTNCHCDHGSFWALIGGIGTAGILFGPGVVFLMLRRRVVWAHPDEICFGCGYDLRATVDPRCPECGRPFPRPAAPTTPVI